MKAISISLIVFISILPSSAIADPIDIYSPSAGYVYFNRPGADMVAHNADMEICARAAVGMVPPKIDYAGGIVGGLITDFRYDGPTKIIFAANIENCMVVHGWRVMRLPDAEGADLAQLPQQELILRMAPWIGGNTPHGDIIRAWDNDLIRSSAYGGTKAAFLEQGQLSWKIDSNKIAFPSEVTQAKQFGGGKLDPQWRRRPYQSAKAPEMSNVPPGSAMIIVRLEGLTMKNAGGISFSRMGETPEESPSVRDHAPDLFEVQTFSKTDNWFIIAVPPGRWRILGFWPVNLCLGSPAFDVKAGDVIYAGAFNMSSQNIAPDLTLDPVKTYLSGTPFSSAVQPAAYVNGSLGKCFQTRFYAYEVKGAPFLPGYSLGSMATSPTSQGLKTAPTTGGETAY